MRPHLFILLPSVKLGHRLIGIAVELYRNDWLEKRSDDRTAHQNSLNAYPAAPRVLSRPPNASLPVFLTNRFDLPALAIAEIYHRNRWQIELSFIWEYPDSD